MPRAKAGGSTNAPTTIETQVALQERSLLEGPRAKGPGRSLPVAKIAPNPENLRDDAAEQVDKREEMRNSLEQVGQIQAIVVATRAAYLEVRPQYADILGPDIEYVILAGERRWLGHVDLGWETIRGEIQDDFLPKMDDVFLHENTGRADLNYFQEAEGYRRLVESGFSLTEIAERNGKSKSYISKRLGILKLPQDAKDLVLAGDLPIESAYNLVTALGTQVDLVLPAWKRMKDQSLSAKEAATATLTKLSHPVISSTPPTSDTPVSPSPAPSVDPVTSSESSAPAEEPRANDSAEPLETSASRVVEGSSPTSTAAALDSEAAQEVPTSPASQEESEEQRRAAATTARQLVCQERVRGYSAEPDSAEATQICVAMIQNAPSGAVSLAHKWLVEAGHVSDSTSPKRYAHWAATDAATPLEVARLAYAVALGAGELRAADQRRAGDASLKAHLQHLMSAGYEPLAGWETALLKG